MDEQDYIKPPRGNKFEDFYALKQIEKILKHKRDGTFKLPKKREAVVLLLSGGLDSIALWNLLMGKYELNVFPIYFLNPKRRRKGQEKSIHIFSKIFKTRYPELFHDVFVKRYSPSFSFSQVKDIDTIYKDLPTLINNLHHYPKYKLHLPIFFNNPARLGNFAFGAYEYANYLKYNKGISVHTILVGIVPEDRGSRESTLAVLRSINLSLCLILGNFAWQFTAPIEKQNKFFFTKKDLITFALKSKLPLEQTWSCNKEMERIHCGSCLNCIMRKDVFKKLNAIDRTRYRHKHPFIARLKSKTKVTRMIQVFLYSLKAILEGRKKHVISRISVATRIAPMRDVIWHEINGSVYLLKLDTGLIEELNAPGSLLWREIAKGPTTLSHLMNTLKVQYDIEKTQLRNDLTKFLKRYIRRGYLVVK